MADPPSLDERNRAAVDDFAEGLLHRVQGPVSASITVRDAHADFEAVPMTLIYDLGGQPGVTKGLAVVCKRSQTGRRVVVNDVTRFLPEGATLRDGIWIGATPPHLRAYPDDIGATAFLIVNGVLGPAFDAVLGPGPDLTGGSAYEESLAERRGSGDPGPDQTLHQGIIDDRLIVSVVEHLTGLPPCYLGAVTSGGGELTYSWAEVELTLDHDASFEPLRFMGLVSSAAASDYRLLSAVPAGMFHRAVAGRMTLVDPLGLRPDVTLARGRDRWVLARHIERKLLTVPGATAGAPRAPADDLPVSGSQIDRDTAAVEQLLTMLLATGKLWSSCTVGDGDQKRVIRVVDVFVVPGPMGRDLTQATARFPALVVEVGTSAGRGELVTAIPDGVIVDPEARMLAPRAGKSHLAVQPLSPWQRWLVARLIANGRVTSVAFPEPSAQAAFSPPDRNLLSG